MKLIIVVELVYLIMMNLEAAITIRNLAIIALASDDELVESLVLKGGNAISLLRGDKSKLSRASFDLDYSIVDGDFDEPDDISNRIQYALIQTFIEKGYHLTDYSFTEKPKNPNPKNNDFWGDIKLRSR